MFKSFLVAALAVGLFGGSAHATTIDIALGSTSGSAFVYGSGGTLNPNLVLTDTPDLSLGVGSGVLAAGTSFGGIALSPTGPLYGNEYLLVTTGSEATLSLAGNNNLFGLTWGSIDDYNTLTLTDSRGVTYSITGAEILARLSNPVAGTSQADVAISDPFGNIVKAVLTSSGNSFEAANFDPAHMAVPLPASSILFAMALAGLLFFARRKQGGAF
jgi:hypothetical protein